jgi:peptidase M23-like protein
MIPLVDSRGKRRYGRPMTGVTADAVDVPATSRTFVFTYSWTNVAIALGGLIGFAVTYVLVLWIYVVTLGPPVFAVFAIGAILWRARRGELEYGLLRHPLRAELRPYLAQAIARLCFLGLLAAALVGGMLGALDVVVSDDTASLLRLAFWLSLAVLAVAALVPHRRVYALTNILLALGVLFLGLEVARMYLPPRNPTTIAMPFTGEWYVFSGGRGVFVNDHWTTSSQRNALDIFQVVNGSSHLADSKQLTSYYAFGKPLLAPADGTITELLDSRPDLAIGDSDRRHPEGNYLVIDIGGGRYVMMGHVRQESALVGVGDHVRLGQALAQVGNSGNTSEPHLHIQVQNVGTFDDADAGIRTYPILFRDAVLVRGGEADAPGDVDARRDDSIRSAS